MSANSTWSLHGTQARLSVDELTGDIDVAKPSAGLRNLSIAGQHQHHELLAVTRSDQRTSADSTACDAKQLNWPLPIGDVYVRGNDLVAGYLPATEWPYSPQVYWQANTLATLDGVRGSLAVMVSVQTHLLDTWPSISVNSRIRSSEVLHLSLPATGRAKVKSVSGTQRIQTGAMFCCLIHRLSDTGLSYVEIMPSADFREVTVSTEASGEITTSWNLFADFLEKGVIWRAQLQAALVPQSNDAELAEACCRALEQRPLPLTT